MSATSSPHVCPCGRTDTHQRALAYSACCGKYHADFEGTPAPDAEALMRSRYSAFVLQNAPYLLATWHPSRRPATLEFDPGARWLGLSVKAHQRLDASHAEVEFVARQRDTSGRATRLHERSRFVHEEGRWFYVDGDQF
ncbi:YchJ family protein [Variovorax sp. HJSM1_2]|uniref:YchJ family protein n=1 Tax=Variovorax sp. HJSM1_2 TaxID=3366263 RepID=UPI003BC7C56F